MALANDFPDDSNTEVSKMRQGLLKFHNDNLAIEDRLETLNYKVISLEEEKKMLENELKRLPGLKVLFLMFACGQRLTVYRIRR